MEDFTQFEDRQTDKWIGIYDCKAALATEKYLNDTYMLAELHPSVLQAQTSVLYSSRTVV